MSPEDTRELCKALLKEIHPARTFDRDRVCLACLELLDHHAEVAQNWLNAQSERDELLPIKSERDELRSQKAALESEVKKEQRRIGAIFLEREDYRAQVAALESRLQECIKSHRKCNTELAALEDKLAEARRVLGIVAPYHDDCYCDEDDGLSGKCVHCVIIDAAGALRAKPEATTDRS